MIILPSLKPRPCHKCSTPTYARHIVKGPTKRSKPARLPLCACCQLGPQKSVEILPTIPYFGKDGTAAATVPDSTKRTQVLAWLKERENKTWKALGNSYSAKMKNWAAALNIPVPDLTALRGGPRKNLKQADASAEINEWDKYREIKARVRTGEMVSRDEFMLLKRMDQTKNALRSMTRRRVNARLGEGVKVMAGGFQP